MLKKNFGKTLSIFLIVFISSSITYSIISITNIRNDEKYTKLLLASKLNEISVLLKDNSENNSENKKESNQNTNEEDEKQINKEEQNIMRQNVRTGDTIAYIVGAVAIIIGINLAILKLKTRKE